MTNIEPSNVVRVIEQYLKENNLLKSLKCLQDETSVSLNTVDSVEAFVNDINAGHWDVVLKVVKLLKLPDNKLIDLYEQIVIELIELRETRAANWLIHKTEPISRLKTLSPDRYSHLQILLTRSYFDPKDAYREGSSKERRRSAIANELKREVTVVPSQRLLTLIGDALKWQKQEGLLPSTTSFDIFTGKAHMEHAEEETFPNVLHKHCVKPICSGLTDSDDGGFIFACCTEFSPDGHYLVIGYSTGFVEVRNPTTGRLANDLKFQADKRYIVTPSKSAALSICFSAADLFAVGDNSGDISIWTLETGELVKLFKSAHIKSVSCLVFHRNGKDILSGGHDGSIKLHGMRSGKTIRDLKGHKSFIYGLAFSRDDNFVISGGSDSMVKIWNVKTAQLLHEYKSCGRVHTIQPMPNFKSDIFLISDRSRCIQFIDLDGKVRSKLNDDLIGEPENSDDLGGKSRKSGESNKKSDDQEAKSMNFFAACSSPKGAWVYAVDSRFIYCFNYSTKKIQRRLMAHEIDPSNDLIGIRHHPFLNLLVTFDTQGNVKLWKP